MSCYPADACNADACDASLRRRLSLIRFCKRFLNRSMPSILTLIPAILLVCSRPATARAAQTAVAFNIRDFGAKGDGIVKETAAIQSAVDAAAKQGGGTVTIPAGRYLSGTIHLKSNITLQISPGAMVAFSPDNSDFDPYET